MAGDLLELALEVFQVDSFRVVDDAGELLLERSGADWSRDGVRISYEPVSDFLYALVGAAGETGDRARGGGRRSGADLDNPEVELALEGQCRRRGARRSIRAGNSMIGGRLGREFLLALSEGTVDDLRVKLQAIRDEAVLGDEPGRRSKRVDGRVLARRPDTRRTPAAARQRFRRA